MRHSYSGTVSTALSKQEIAYLNVAIRVAKKSLCRQKHGAVLVRGGRVLAISSNSHRNHPDTLGTTTDIAACTSYHAEWAVIKYAAKYSSLEKATLYIARVNGRYEERLSKPCRRCDLIIRNYGITKVVWTI